MVPARGIDFAYRVLGWCGGEGVGVSRLKPSLPTQRTSSPDPGEGADRLFLDRVRLGLWLVLAGVAMVFFGKLFIYYPGELSLINVIQGINFIVVAVALRFLHDPRRRGFNLAVGFLSYVVTIVAAAGAGIVAQDATTPVVLMVALSVVTATLVPWSPWWQLISVVVIAVTAIWTVATIVDAPRLYWLQHVGTMAPTLASTVLIAYVLQRQRLALDSAEQARRNREESLREANTRLEREIQEHRRTEDMLRFAMRELDHRVKNTLATVQAVADQTLRSSRSMEEFGDAFTGRLHAMARIHNALAERRWEGLTMTELIELVVGPYRHHASSISIECDGTFVSSELVRVLGLSLHELATNAAKYGALSTRDGHVTIASRADSDDAAHSRICWSERGGPSVREPARRGFGIRLIEEALAYEVDGRATLEFPSPGLRCEIEIPLPSVAT